MEKIRLWFFIAGTFFFGVGMIGAGILKVFNHQFTLGVIYIIAAILIIALCVFAFWDGKGTGKR